jgi:hypothetical protein
VTKGGGTDFCRDRPASLLIDKSISLTILLLPVLGITVAALVLKRLPEGGTHDGKEFSNGGFG